MTKNETAAIENQATRILSGPGESREFPDWFRDQQRAAWKLFESLPTPTRKDQPWRFTNVNLLDLSPFKDRKSTRLNSSHLVISYAVFCLKKKKKMFITYTLVATVVLAIRLLSTVTGSYPPYYLIIYLIEYFSSHNMCICNTRCDCYATHL